MSVLCHEDTFHLIADCRRLQLLCHVLNGFSTWRLATEQTWILTTFCNYETQFVLTTLPPLHSEDISRLSLLYSDPSLTTKWGEPKEYCHWLSAAQSSLDSSQSGQSDHISALLHPSMTFQLTCCLKAGRCLSAAEDIIRSWALKTFRHTEAVWYAARRWWGCGYLGCVVQSSCL